MQRRVGLANGSHSSSSLCHKVPRVHERSRIRRMYAGKREAGGHMVEIAPTNCSAATACNIMVNVMASKLRPCFSRFTIPSTKIF